MAEIGLQYDLETPWGTIQFNRTSNTNYYYLTRVDGIAGAALRTSSAMLVARDGEVAHNAYSRGRIPVLSGTVVVRETSEATALATRRQMLDDLAAALASIRREDGTLKWPYGSSNRQLTVRAWEAIQVNGGWLKEFQFGLFAADPTIVSQTLETFDSSTLASGVNFPTWSLGGITVHEDFVETLTGWTLTDSAPSSVTRTLDTLEKRSAAGSHKMVNTSAGAVDYEAKQFGSLALSTAYTIRVWVKVSAFTSGAVSNRGLYAYDILNEGTTAQTATITAVTAGWVELSVTVTTTSAGGSHTIEVRLYSPQATVNYDDVTIHHSPTTAGWTLGDASGNPTWELGMASEPGLLGVTNDGNAEAWPIFRVHGTVDGTVRILNTTTGAELRFDTLTVPAGSYAEIDTWDETAYLNGDPTLTLLGGLNSSASEFFTLQPGLNRITMLAAAFDATAKLEVLHRDSYA